MKKNATSLKETHTSGQARLSLEGLKFAKILNNPSSAKLRELATKDETTTEYGSASYVTKYRSRAAQFTRTTFEGTVTEDDLRTLEEVKRFAQKLEMIQLDRVLGQAENQMHCRLLVSKPFARLGYMFSCSLGELKSEESNPDFVTVDIPEYPGERRILVDPISGITYVLGSDYYGEIKKSFLRQFMFSWKQSGALGLHAGSKEVWAKSAKSDEIKRKGLLFFGLSGTGKTSLTCHEYNLDSEAGERIKVRQDDVVALLPNSFCVGSEPEGFYIKTEGLDPEDQKALYQAATSPRAIFENVWVEKDGKVDFFNTELTGNGRAIAKRREVMFTDDSIDMPSTDMLFFITRNPLVPAVARLNKEQAVAAFMLGESVKTSAADPNAKGEPVREVGTNPFIVGDRAFEGHRLQEILDQNPKIQSFLLNTGKLGVGESARKIKILETVAIIREICRDAVEWRKDPISSLEIPEAIEGVNSEVFDLSRWYSEEDLQVALIDLREQRRKWLEQFDNLGEEIIENVY